MLTDTQLEALQAIRTAAGAMAARVAKINDTIREQRLPIPLVPMPHQLGALIDSVDYETAKHDRTARRPVLEGAL